VAVDSEVVKSANLNAQGRPVEAQKNHHLNEVTIKAAVVVRKKEALEKADSNSTAI
jgi:hypothetical protein